MGLPGPFSRTCGLYSDSNANRTVNNVTNNITMRNPIAPNPHKFKVLASFSVGKFLVLKAQYVNCTNYEGVKIMVYKNLTLRKVEDLKGTTGLDPHFNDKKSDDMPSPIARFEPTDDGWKNAKKFAKMLHTQG